MPSQSPSFRPQHCLALALLVAFSASCPRGVFADEQTGPAQATILARGEDFIIHARRIDGVFSGKTPWIASEGIQSLLPAMAPRVDATDFTGETASLTHASVVTHISITTGKIRCLFVSGDSMHSSPPMNLGWWSKHSVRLLGLTVVGNYLYLLSGESYDSFGRINEIRNGQVCRLQVFAVDTGKQLASTLVNKEFKALPEDTHKAGPLTIEGDKITVFEQTWQFDGKEFVAE